MALGSIWCGAGAHFGPGARVLHLDPAVPWSPRAVSNICCGELSGGEEPGWMSGLADLVRELQLLREEVAGLASRVGALENRPESRSLASGSPVTLNYTFAGASTTPYPEAPAFPTFSPAQERQIVQSPGSSARSGAVEHTEAERRAVATSIGLFFARCLAGQPRGSSSRDKIQLPSKVYVLCKDHSGRTYSPVVLFDQFSKIKPLVKPRGDCGDSVFAGFPTHWEARIAVASAGLIWPEEATYG